VRLAWLQATCAHSLPEFRFDADLATVCLFQDLAGGSDIGLGWLEDGLALAAGLDDPGGAGFGGVGFFGGFTGAGEVVDLGLGLAGRLADARQLLWDFLVHSFQGEAESLLAPGFPLRLRGEPPVPLFRFGMPSSPDLMVFADRVFECGAGLQPGEA
jgi:hypothetical protein